MAKMFLDTCSALSLQEDIFKLGFQDIYISSLSLVELENIKTSGTKDETLKYSARSLLHIFENKEGQYTIVPYNTEWDQLLNDNHYLLNNDARIISTAYHILDKDDYFVTDDLSCKSLARGLGLNTKFSKELNKKDEYTGYKTKHAATEEALADIYENIIPNNQNVFGLITNQYLLIEDQDYNIIDAYCWTGSEYERVKFQKIESKMFGRLAPKDIYQQCFIHSLYKNQMNLVTAPAGAGKSYIGLAYLYQELERGRIDRIIVLCNPTPARGASKLGFYPGERDSKLLESSVGSTLITKFGDRGFVEDMLDNGTLWLVPAVDVRGMDLSGLHAGVWILEAQNLDINLMKLLLQRIGDDSICLIDGDFKQQLDMNLYEGKNNGMQRVIDVFKGEPFFGTITLKNIYRSQISKIADKM